MPTLIVEDGTCPDGANSYASLADADAYCTARGLWAESADDAAIVAKKETSLIRAADWLNAIPGGKWKEEQVNPDWPMAWPRTGYSGVPSAVKRAQMEVAALIYSGTDVLAPQVHGGEVASESVSTTKSVGTLSKSESHSVSYRGAAPAETYYPAVAGLLERYLAVTPGRKCGAGFVEVGRG